MDDYQKILITYPKNKSFGLFFAFIFLVLSLYLYFLESFLLALIFMIFSFIFLVMSLFFEDNLLPFNKLWTHFGIMLGSIISPIILGLIFFGIVSFISLLSRLFGRDELKLKFKAHPSYWKPKQPGPPNFKLQY